MVKLGLPQQFLGMKPKLSHLLPLQRGRVFPDFQHDLIHAEIIFTAAYRTNVPVLSSREIFRHLHRKIFCRTFSVFE